MSIRCHYVPNFYLKYFSVPENKKDIICVYDKKDGSFRKIQTKSVAVIKDYYLSDPNEKGEKNKQAEQELSNIEGNEKLIFDEWIKLPRKWNISQARQISLFLAVGHCRVPRAVSATEEMHRAALEVAFEKIKPQILNREPLLKSYKKAGFDNHMTFEEFQKFAPKLLAGAHFTIDPKRSLGTSFQLGDLINRKFLSMRWQLCEITTRHFFITTDAPVNIFAPMGENEAIFGAGFHLPQVEIFFPITPKIGLYINNTNKVAYRKADGFFVEEMNKRAAAMAEQYVFSPYTSNKVHKLVRLYKETFGKPKVDVFDFKKQFEKRFKLNDNDER